MTKKGVYLSEEFGYNPSVKTTKKTNTTAVKKTTVKKDVKKK